MTWPPSTVSSADRSTGSRSLPSEVVVSSCQTFWSWRRNAATVNPSGVVSMNASPRSTASSYRPSAIAASHAVTSVHVFRTGAESTVRRMSSASAAAFGDPDGSWMPSRAARARRETALIPCQV